MNSDFYHTAYDRLISDCWSAIRDKQRLLDELAEAEKRLHEFYSAAKSIAAILNEELPNFEVAGKPNPSVIVSKDFSKPLEKTFGSLSDAIEEVFRRLDSTARVNEIADELIAMNYPLNSDDHKRFGAIYSALKRRPDKFSKIRRGEWVLRGSPSDDFSFFGHEEIADQQFSELTIDEKE